jgi:pimeloyl-ACP methyl ester carboxylesterase
MIPSWAGAHPALVVRSPDGTPIGVFRMGVGPPLVLVHGASADHTTFRVVGPRFAQRHAVYAMDRRGRGASGNGPAYAIEREFEDVASVIDAVAAETGDRVDVLGHSFGGRVALGAAPLSANLRRLVVYESAPAPAGMTFEPPDLLARLTALAAAANDQPAMLLRTFMTEVVGMTPTELAAYEESPVWDARVSAAPTIVRELVADAETSMERLVAGVHVPVLQLLGGASRPIFALGTSALDDALPDGRVVILEGQKHAAHHTDPERFVAAVESFLER